ncbi:hypothetical protein [Weissella koreensis]|uniref:Uncharacterized protein n=1 Tax=Weissella koreensis TaxID=165096 RepID=A0A7H1MLT6_9LACO|nr:hypothetical protein [Weissella koreensis]AVH75218.1 hypothetical protein C4597_03880 [Weissella koreensis]QGN20443.1 hypothetical protein GKC51_03860 [Weissella koreensis]QNT64422.1 hypothetical protein FY536_03585 [Weissella koreensis]
MEEVKLKHILNELISIICDAKDIVSRQNYPMESVVMFADELGYEELPDFISSDSEYIMEYVVSDLNLNNGTELESILVNFLDIRSNNPLGLALIKDNQLMATRKEGDKEWIF